MDLTYGRTGNDFLDSLSNSDFNLLIPFLSEANLALGSVVCVPDAELDTVWFPVSAVLSVITVMRDGEGIEACTIGHETAYGLLNALGASLSTDRVVSQIPGGAVRMPGARLKAAAALSMSMTDLIIRHAQANAAQSQQSVACNAIHNVPARLCRWLLMTADRTRSDRLPLTQEFLGFMLGVQRTTVTGAARSLQAAGLIRYVRGQIEILDRAGLEAGSCECYRAVQEKHVQLLGKSPG